MTKNSGGASKGGTGSGGKGGASGGSQRSDSPGWPSRTGNPSGGGRDNAPPRTK